MVISGLWFFGFCIANDDDATTRMTKNPSLTRVRINTSSISIRHDG